jgi:hypothetical protein
MTVIGMVFIIISRNKRSFLGGKHTSSDIEINELSLFGKKYNHITLFKNTPLQIHKLAKYVNIPNKEVF